MNDIDHLPGRIKTLAGILFWTKTCALFRILCIYDGNDAIVHSFFFKMRCFASAGKGGVFSASLQIFRYARSGLLL